MVEDVSDVQKQLIECINAALKKVGPSVPQVVYIQLEKNFRTRKEEILDHPRVFSALLYSIFGRGSGEIERLIVHKIQEKFRLYLEPKSSLVKAIQAVNENKWRKLNPSYWKDWLQKWKETHPEEHKKYFKNKERVLEEKTP